MASSNSQHLCAFCQGINLEALKSAGGYVHQPTCDTLINSAEHCSLCHLLVALFRRRFYMWRSVMHPVRQLSDARSFGPVSLFAASRDLDLDEWRFQRRPPGPVTDCLLSRRVADDPICDYNISKILKWANGCQLNHDACNLRFSTSQPPNETTPKRLIHVGKCGQADARLVDARPIMAGGSQARYVALSYCWGRNHTGIITTDDNVNQMMRGFRLTQVSNSIQDAIEVTRKLGIGYLWVDALYWKEESTKMGHIYSNAYLTIAATSASDASEGFLRRANRPGVPVDFKVDSRKYITPGIYIAEDIENSPLLRRAWAQQERTFSCRTVDFGSRQIYLGCRMSKCLENGEIDTDSAIEKASLIHGLRTWTIPRQLFFKTWAELVEGYSALELTCESDRLPALAGTATIVGHLNLSHDLLWKPSVFPAQLSGQPSTPTWSWASVLVPVNSLGGYNPEESQIRLLRASTNNLGRQALHLSGRIHRCKVDVIAQPPSPPCRSDRKLKDSVVHFPSYNFRLEAAVGPQPLGISFLNECEFDRLRGVETDFYALGLIQQTLGDTNRKSGLLLRRVKDGDNNLCYERVGRIWSSDRFWYALEDSEVCLV
ncbi:HET-domain-containing protein [Xylariaceae sp. FL0662B]|nr:HET-domain-containing protein [Xylariaceae sp. FL0662B]